MMSFFVLKIWLYKYVKALAVYEIQYWYDDDQWPIRIAINTICGFEGGSWFTAFVSPSLYRSG